MPSTGMTIMNSKNSSEKILPNFFLTIFDYYYYWLPVDFITVDISFFFNFDIFIFVRA